jgi:hypothetical protein
MRLSADLPLLTNTERSCLERYLDLLVEQLGDQLVEVAVYGSVARGAEFVEQFRRDAIVLYSRPA